MFVLLSTRRMHEKNTHRDAAVYALRSTDDDFDFGVKYEQYNTQQTDAVFSTSHR